MERTCAIRLNEWESCPPLQWPDKRPVYFEEGEPAQIMAEELTRSKILSVIETRRGISLEASSYVGRISLGPLQVTIQPKLSGLKLLRLMKYAYGLRDLQLYSNVDYALKEDAFQEILISQLAREAENLINRGLYRQYKHHNEYLSSPRGRIDINQIAVNGGIITSTIPCTHHSRDIDCLPNQVLGAGLRLAANICDNVILKIKLRRLKKLLLTEVSSIQLNYHILQRLDRESNRLVEAYKPAFRIIRILMEGFGLSLDNREQVKFEGFLFDMNRFFQVLLSRFINEYLSGYNVQDEFRLHGMMKYQPGKNPQGRRSPCPRPDFAIFRSTTLVRLLDAKYRDLWEKPPTRDMLYQLSIYALSQEPGPKSQAAILYPTLNRAAKEAIIMVNDPVTARPRGMVILRPVNLAILEELIRKRGTLGVERIAAGYAYKLVFGEATNRETGDRLRLQLFPTR